MQPREKYLSPVIFFFIIYFFFFFKIVRDPWLVQALLIQESLGFLGSPEAQKSILT